MDNLMFLYRYLVQNKPREGQEPNAYTRAYDALEHVFGMLESLEYDGQHIRDTGGIMWEQADKIVERLGNAHKVALISATGDESPVAAIVDFARWIQVEEYPALIKLLQDQQDQRAREQTDTMDYPTLRKRLDAQQDQRTHDQGQANTEAGVALRKLSPGAE